MNIKFIDYLHKMMIRCVKVIFFRIKKENIVIKNGEFEFFVTSQIMFDLFCASYQVGAGNIAYSDCFILLGWGYIDR